MNEVLLSPAPSFKTALMRAFGPREELRAILLHALRRGTGGRVLLLMMPDDALWLIAAHDSAPPHGAVLLELTAPSAPVSEEALALRVDVIDWRGAAHAYDTLLARRARRPMP